MCETKELTNLVDVTDLVGINHNASTMLTRPYLDVVKKKKNGTYKWRSRKKPSKKMAETLLEMTNQYTYSKKN